MTGKEKEDLRCNCLILVTTRSEREALELAAKEAGLPFERRKLPGVERYYHLGMVGNMKVNAAPTEMGPLGHQGSAARAMTLAALALDLRIATAATGIIQLGMAFGVDPILQRVGDVLVSTSLVPYDNRDVVVGEVERLVMPPADEVSSEGNAAGDTPDDVPYEGTRAAATPVDAAPPAAATPPGPRPAVGADHPYRTDYSRAKRHYAKQSLLQMMRREADRGGYGHRVFFGGLLSGGARIFSRRFLKELVNGVPRAEDGIVGGDMEGVGLLSVSSPDAPLWIVVKAISDFADETRGSAFEEKSRAHVPIAVLSIDCRRPRARRSLWQWTSRSGSCSTSKPAMTVWCRPCTRTAWRVRRAG